MRIVNVEISLDAILIPRKYDRWMKSMERDEGWRDFKPIYYEVLHCLPHSDSSEGVRR